MKPKILLFLLCGLATTLLTAQTENNKILRGKVLFQNSNFTPAESVSIAGVIKVEKEEYANKVNTDSKGQYELKFPLARKGHPVKLTIGNTDKAGKEIEVVNEKELQLCRIPANATQEFEIIVCPKGARDIAARKYYKILKNSAELAYEQLQEQFRTLTQAQNKDYNTIQQVADDLTKLQKQLHDSVALYKEAMAIASINKDGVNERVINYLKLLDEGKSVQEARKALSIIKASNDMDKGIKLFRASVKELEERARASAAVFDYKDAVVCYDTLIAKAEKLNISQVELSDYYIWVGEFTRNIGYYQKAYEYDKKTVSIRERLLDSLNINLATAYNNLAVTYTYLGKYGEALITQQKALRLEEILLKPTHPTLARSYNNLSSIYQDLGSYQEALIMQQKALKIREALLDTLHPSIAICNNNLATIYFALGQYQKALTKQQKALKVNEKILKPNHPQLATSYNNLATFYLALGQYQEALITQQKALTIQENIQEADHPELAGSYKNLSSIYQALGRYKEALNIQKKSINILEIVLKPDHPDLASSYNNLASIYQELDQSKSALTNQLKAHEILESTMEPDHPSIATSYNNLASIYHDLGAYQNALTAQQKGLKIMEATLEANHPNIGASYNILSIIFISLGRYEEALNAQQKTLKIRKATLEPDHRDLANSYVNLSAIYFKINTLSKSIYYSKKALEIFRKSLPESHPYNENIIKNLVFIQKQHVKNLYQEERYKEALQILDAVIKQREDITAWLYKGSCHYYLKEYSKAITAYQKALALDSTLKQQYYYNNIGTAFVKNQQFPEAKEAFTAYQKLFPKQGRPYRNWAMYYALQNQKDEALDNLEKAIALGFKELQWLQTDDSINNIRNEPRFKALLEKLKE